MFEDLKTLIARENMAKVKASQRYQHSPPSHHDSSSDDEELNERKLQFETLMTEQQVRQAGERQMWGKRAQWKQRELMEEKLRLAEEMQRREVDYLKESHQRELAALQAEICKLEQQIQRQVKEEAQLAALRRDNRRLVELQEDTDRMLQKQSAELSIVRRESQQLRLKVRQLEEKEAQMVVKQHSQSQVEKRLKEEVAALEKERTIEAERRKQMESTISKLRQEKEQLERSIDLVHTQMEAQKQEITLDWKSKIERIQQENTDLKRRNRTLEQSFIEHLTQTSLNLQQTLKTVPERTHKNTSLYLDSPIRTRSPQAPAHHDHQQTLSLQDPQKQQPCACQPQLSKLKSKLKQANGKIVQLLREKCEQRR